MVVEEIIDELEKYSVVGVDEKGEIETYETSILLNVVRRRELKIISNNVASHSSKLILDYGCGGGWLSRFLFRKGFDVVGIDVNIKLVRKAKDACSRVEFVVCDAEKLPFRDAAFDVVIGVAILHHLNVRRSCRELERILNEKSKFVFLEPNSLNPLSAIGRRFFPTEAHTKGEKAFVPSYLKTVLNQTGFALERYFTLFSISFPLARLFKIARIRPPLSVIRLISLFESAMESMPMMKQLNSTIVTVGTIV
ncbi:class I SAM-dependent methyltransferase [Candidatus Bathyarchaeota archaeon]|nr:class I SAM-dependent methyltransferase [Candidatus Bathyarchaeota archaeon]